MIPVLSPEAEIDAVYRDFMDRLAGAGFAGEIERDYAARVVMSTDNSAFQQMPEGVLFPRDEDDIARVFTLLAEPEFHGVHVAPRGGGTSTIGCSLNRGLVLDCSRHMNRILEIDVEAGRVRVEPGVVLDQLNDALAAAGVFFAPNVAPSSRATLGGMANTDGCGKGSRVYGKTSDHVLESRWVLADGSRFAARPVNRAELAELQDRSDLVGRIHRAVDAAVSENQDEIERVFPRLSRYLSGYNLAQVFDAGGERCNLNKLICGSEGTLAVVSELTLRLSPIPKVQTLFAVRYDSFDDALRDAERLVGFEPTAIESLDDKIMGLARNNPIYERVREMIENADGSTPGAVNLVQFDALDDPALAESIAVMESALDGADAGRRANGFYRAQQPEKIAALWDLRKGGVGLLGSTPGDRKPLPFVEDTVVDPRYLADYIRDFRAVLDEYGLEYGMFGHIDVGCLHVRPALNLCDPDDERIMREVTARVETLARGYGGLLWNEHGKGFRSEYNPDYFGPTLYGVLARIKQAFDPYNQLNPGKIVAPADAATRLAAMDATTRGAYNREIPAAPRRVFEATINCNGNAACHSHDPSSVMCPSYRVTRDRLHSPKGRAEAMRAWLRLLAGAGFDPLHGDSAATRPLWRAAARDALSPARMDRDADFSHQVWATMDGCLSCKACASQCPVKVNVPAFKSRFLALYHGRYPRPLGDYALAWLEPTAQRLARLPRFANALAQSAFGRAAVRQIAGLSDPPSFSVPGLGAFLREHNQFAYSAQRYRELGANDRNRVVFIVQDAFTSFFDAAVVIDAIRLIARLGYQPRVLPFMANGKALQVKGFLPAFARTAAAMAGFLREIADLGRPLIGVDPSVTLTYRDEYPAQIGVASVPRVALLEEWLADALTARGDRDQHPARDAPTHTLLQHCTAESTAPESTRAWQQAFAAAGLRLDRTPVGCCGMSGLYGHETRHQRESRGIYDLSWRTAFEKAAAIPVVPGYSCRSQLRRFGAHRPRHPAQALLSHLAAAMPG